MRKGIIIIILLLYLFLPVLAYAGGEIKGTILVTRARNSSDVIVYLEDAPASVQPKVHPRMEIRNMTFVPHILPLVVGSTVDFINGDDVVHHVSSDSETGQFSLGSYYKGKMKEVLFDKIGDISLQCELHPNMSGFIVVLPSAYFTKTDMSGNFRITNVPAGTYTLKTWHEKKIAREEKVTVTDGASIEVSFSL